MRRIRPSKKPLASPTSQVEREAGVRRPERAAPPVVDEYERIERRKFVLSLLLAGATGETIAEAAAQRSPPIPYSAALAIAQEIRKQWREEFAQQSRELRTEQVVRLRRDLVQMRMEVKKPWSAIRAHERLLASIEGNLAPMRVRVDLDATIRETTLAVVGNLDADAYEELLREQLEVERAAEVGRRALLTEGVEVEPRHDRQKESA